MEFNSGFKGLNLVLKYVRSS